MLDSPRSGGWVIRDTTTGSTIGEPLSFGERARDGRRMAVFSPDGGRIAIAGPDGNVRLFAAETGQLLHVLQHAEAPDRVAFAPTGDRLATVAGRQAFLWNAETAKQIGPLLEHDFEISTLVWSADGQHLATGGMNGTVKLWNGRSGAAVSGAAEAAANDERPGVSRPGTSARDAERTGDQRPVLRWLAAGVAGGDGRSDRLRGRPGDCRLVPGGNALVAHVAGGTATGAEREVQLWTFADDSLTLRGPGPRFIRCRPTRWPWRTRTWLRSPTKARCSSGPASRWLRWGAAAAHRKGLARRAEQGRQDAADPVARGAGPRLGRGPRRARQSTGQGRGSQ